MKPSERIHQAFKRVNALESEAALASFGTALAGLFSGQVNYRDIESITTGKSPDWTPSMVADQFEAAAREAVKKARGA